MKTSTSTLPNKPASRPTISAVASGAQFTARQMQTVVTKLRKAEAEQKAAVRERDEIRKALQALADPKSALYKGSADGNVSAEKVQRALRKVLNNTLLVDDSV